MADPRLDEASGLALGIRSPGVAYVQNDSGDTNRVFALDAHTGRTLAVVTIPGARNVDWEDIGVAPDRAGDASLWIGDIGDNDLTRREVDVYRVPEPHIVTSDRDVPVVAASPAIWRLRYPDGPADAESLAVAPNGTGYVITKSAFGASRVYRLPAHPDADHVQTLEVVGTVQFTATGTANPFGITGQLAATGAAISPSGTLLAVRTYADLWLWRIESGDVAAALRTRPTVSPLPDQPQGEGVAFDGNRLLVDSEGVHSAVYSLALPRLPAQPGTLPPSRTDGPAARTGTSDTRTDTTTSGHATPRARSSDAGPDWPAIALFAGIVAALGTACGLNRRRLRRR